MGERGAAEVLYLVSLPKFGYDDNLRLLKAAMEFFFFSLPLL